MEELDKRIGRIAGQLRGIQKMVQAGRDNVEILQQISAVKKAIDGLTKEILYLKLDETLTVKQAAIIKKMVVQIIHL